MAISSSKPTTIATATVMNHGPGCFCVSCSSRFSISPQITAAGSSLGGDDIRSLSPALTQKARALGLTSLENLALVRHFVALYGPRSGYGVYATYLLALARLPPDQRRAYLHHIHSIVRSFDGNVLSPSSPESTARS